MPEATDFPFVAVSGAFGVSSDSDSASLSLALEEGVEAEPGFALPFPVLPLADEDFAGPGLDFEEFVVVLDGSSFFLDEDLDVPDSPWSFGFPDFDISFFDLLLPDFAPADLATVLGFSSSSLNSSELSSSSLLASFESFGLLSVLSSWDFLPDLEAGEALDLLDPAPPPLVHQKQNLLISIIEFY